MRVRELEVVHVAVALLKKRGGISGSGQEKNCADERHCLHLVPVSYEMISRNQISATVIRCQAIAASAGSGSGMPLSSTGRVKKKVEPVPISLSTRTSPPCALTRCL